MLDNGKWARELPIIYKKDIKLKPRQVLPLEIFSSYPDSTTFRVIDVEWLSKDNVPVIISNKKSIYNVNSEGIYFFHKMDICLFNVSDHRSATVDLYAIEEVYFSNEDTKEN
ncbi:hypothetical protein P4324_15650 [Bacillus thuringiensis]|nr:hypothetical protein [Bacillus thuringiensis]MED2923471.1 hypothetical protein [Bacillus thuringiensis]MED3047015.1 hypothetical protein [Bacillus thuringiensis]